MDIIDKLKDLHKQATQERSHFYVGSCVRDAIDEIERLRQIANEPARSFANILEASASFIEKGPDSILKNSGPNALRQLKIEVERLFKK